MKIELLHLQDIQKIVKVDYDLPPLKNNQFIIKTKFCAICRNDINAYQGIGWQPPLGRFGHEAIGYIAKLHEEYKGKFKIGDQVATFDSDPGFGEYYYSDDSRAVLIPEISPRYIMEPIACSLNVIIKTISYIISSLENGDENPKILLIGSGFMSLIIKQYCNYIGIDIEVAGIHHRDVWEKFGVNLKPFRFYIDKRERFNAVIDLSGYMDYYSQIINELTEIGAVVCFASSPNKDVILDFNTSAWRDLTYIFPSPRSKSFLDIMELGVKLISENIISTDFLWSKGYNFESILDCRLGFYEGMNRDENYFKGYIKF